jgi:hypothetical protein
VGDGVGVATTEVFDGAAVVEAVLKEVDDLLVGDVDYGSALVEEAAHVLAERLALLLTVYFGAPSMFITLWFGFDYGTNPPLGTLII